MKKKLAVIVCALLFFSIAGCSSGPNMKEGNWKITTEMSMKGMPMKMPAMVHEQCMTKDEIIPQSGQQAEENCTVSNQKINGDTVSWDVVCKDGNSESKSDGTITYSGETFEGSINLTISGGPVQMTATNTISGKYLGPCK